MKEQIFKVRTNCEIAANIFELTLEGEVSESINHGQFANVSIPNRHDLILKRPLGLAKYGKDFITVCYQVVGQGTAALRELKSGAEVGVTYPLGNGFYTRGKKRVMLVAGGAGAFPILSVAEHEKTADCYTFLGFGSKQQALYVEEFQKASRELFIATNDGSLGESGFVTDIVKREIERICPEIILSCGPKPMYRALKAALTGYEHIPTLISLEERMGCGIGACLVCTCAINGFDGLHNRRVCADGPVFNLYEVTDL